MRHSLLDVVPERGRVGQTPSSREAGFGVAKRSALAGVVISPGGRHFRASLSRRPSAAVCRCGNRRVAMLASNQSTTCRAIRPATGSAVPGEPDRRFFDIPPRPTRVAVGSRRLPAGALIGIDALATATYDGDLTQ